jgi:hypothetical protein
MIFELYATLYEIWLALYFHYWTTYEWQNHRWLDRGSEEA